MTRDWRLNRAQTVRPSLGHRPNNRSETIMGRSTKKTSEFSKSAKFSVTAESIEDDLRSGLTCDRTEAVDILDCRGAEYFLPPGATTGSDSAATLNMEPRLRPEITRGMGVDGRRSLGSEPPVRPLSAGSAERQG